MASQTEPGTADAHPRLSHEHSVGLSARPGVDVVSDGASQNCGIPDDDDVGIFEPLTVPLVPTTDVRFQVGLPIEKLTRVRRPTKTGMQ